MPPTRMLRRLQTGGHDGRLRVDVADATPWLLEYKGKDCVGDDDSDDDSTTFSSTTFTSTSVDCHVLVRWSKLANLVKKRMACVVCGLPVTSFFEGQTLGMAVDVDFFCATCDLSKTAAALWSDKNVLELSKERNILNIEDQIDCYELNWQLIVATELLGESQIG
jgi:hypothetical protein